MCVYQQYQCDVCLPAIPVWCVFTHNTSVIVFTSNTSVIMFTSNTSVICFYHRERTSTTSADTWLSKLLMWVCPVTPFRSSFLPPTCAQWPFFLPPVLSVLSSPHLCSVSFLPHTCAQCPFFPTPVLSVLSSPHLCPVSFLPPTCAQYPFLPTPVLSVLSSPHLYLVAFFPPPVFSVLPPPPPTCAQYPFFPTPVLSVLYFPQLCSVSFLLHTCAQCSFWWALNFISIICFKLA